MSALDFVTPDPDLVDRIRQGLRAHVSGNTTEARLHLRLVALSLSLSLSSASSSSPLELEPAPQRSTAVSAGTTPPLRLVNS